MEALTDTADLNARVEAFYTWLQDTNGATPTAADISNAQAALLAAASAYDARPGTDAIAEVTAQADTLYTDIAAHAAGNGTA